MTRRPGAAPIGIHGLTGATVSRSPVRSRFVVTDWMVLLLLVVLTLAGMVAGSALMAAPGILVLCMVGLGRLWTHLALLDLRYHACVSRRRVMIGDTIEIVVTVENHKPLPISWLRIVDAIPSGLEIESEGSDAYRVRNGFETQVVTRLGPYQRLRITHRVRAAHRIGSARLSASDPFGLYESGMQVASAPDTVVVYPASMALADPPVPMLRPLGDHVSRFALSADRTRPSGTREYRAGDPARDIDWKSSAKRDRLFVRTYDASVTGHVVIALDCEMGRTGPWLARVEMLERGVALRHPLRRNSMPVATASAWSATATPPASEDPSSYPPGEVQCSLRWCSRDWPGCSR